MTRNTEHIDSKFLLQVLDAIEGLVFVKDAERRFVYANTRFLRACGMEDVTGLRSEDYEPEEKAAVFRQKDEDVLNSGKPLVWEGANSADGWEIVKRLPFPMPDGSTGILSVIFDITEFHDMQVEVEALRRTEALALHDPLTGLPNRRHLERHFDALRSEDTGTATLLHLDLDGFKPINDEHGHAAGDAVLVEVAQRMKHALQDDMFAARIGGDEFVIVALFPDLAKADEWANVLLNDIGAPLYFESTLLQVGSSCGIAHASEVTVELDAMMQAADIALYQAKERGKNRVELFTADVRTRLEEERNRNVDVHRGMEQREFFPLYQPQIDLETGQMVGIEALARWHHPERGLLPPAEFIPVFEAQGRLADLDIMMLDAVIEDVERMKQDGTAHDRVSVNMSESLLAREDLIDIFKSRVPFDFTLAIELSEAVSFENLDTQAQFRIDSLRAFGCEIEVDDFGSAQASILGVIALQPDRLKIDKGLVMPMLDSPQSSMVVKAILEIANALDVPVIAEGVESAEHVSKLRQMGCQVGQGFHFARPLSPEDLMTFVRNRVGANAHSLKSA